MKTLRYSIVISLLFISLPAQAQDLSSIGQLARDGAPGLALELLSEIQPEAEENFDGWLFFERQRVDILRDWNMWTVLLSRLAQFPKTAPKELQRWAQVEMANALLQTEQGEPAREVLRQLLWQPPELLSVEEFSLYRRLVIRSYLVDDRLPDARRAMLRYAQDYGNKGVEWINLQARVFLRTDRPQDAESLFVGVTDLDPESKAIMLLVQLRASKRAPSAIIGDTQTLLKDKKLKPADQARYWKVLAEAATAIGDHLSLIRALESAALLSRHIQGDALFSINGDDLWQAYQQYASYEANSMQLLIGQDAMLLQQAESSFKKQAERSRAFFSLLMVKGADTATREQAIRRFIESATANDNGILLLRKLFLDAKQFAAAESVPNGIRYFLVDDALSRNDIETATHLMSGLQQAPKDSGAFEWGLRRARVLILGGKAAEGIGVLNQLISEAGNADKDKVDRATQVVFDLQTVGRHQQAIELFDRLLKLAVDPQLRRELLYWQADSYQALQNNVHAALLYLQSATLLDGNGFDPWGQTARFRAAEVLTDAGLIDDAERQYETLMKVTREPSRRAAIRYKLQELWLKKQNPDKSAG